MERTGPVLQIFIPGLLTTVLETAAANLRFRDRIEIFEVGRVFLPQPDQQLPDEAPRLVILMTGPRDDRHWLATEGPDLDFYDLKGVVEALLGGLHIGGAAYEAAEHPTYQPGRTARLLVDGVEIGLLGEIHPQVRAAWDLPDRRVAAAATAWTGSSAVDDLRAAEAAVDGALDLIIAGDAEGAQRSIETATTRLSSFESSMESPLTTGAAIVPVVAQHRSAALDVSRSANEALRSITSELDAFDLDAITAGPGAIDLDAVRALERPMLDFQSALGTVSTTLDEARDAVGELHGLQFIGASGAKRFLKGALREEMVRDLRSYLQAVREPLAVRSSSILEDSHNLPLAGLYSTYMLPNSDDSLEERLGSLLAAIKLVWASTFGDNPRAYFRQTSYRLEDERMAVVVQTLGGCRRGNYFYPTFSGVAQSHNFYPISYMKPEDGVAQIALGLGKTVVEGGPIVRFCPRYPMLLPQFADMRDWLYFTQKSFYALDMDPIREPRDPATMDRLRPLPLSVAESQWVLQKVASVYQSDSGLLVDSFFYDGPRIVTFQKVLRDPRLKFGELLCRLLSVCERSMRIPVEIEFACDLPEDQPPVFYPLQLRPMASKKRWERIEISAEHKQQAFCYSNMAHGNGVYRGICDLAYVKPETFDISKTREIAREIGDMNKELADENRPYVLVGFGRWGSTDPWMGIGVGWAQISGVKVLVEVGIKGFNVDPAQGTHFFQNVTSLNIGCLSVPYGSAAFIRWDQLQAAKSPRETKYLRLLRWGQPLEICIDGRRGEAVIVLPDSSPERV